jgi:hypothetical protein
MNEDVVISERGPLISTCLGKQGLRLTDFRSSAEVTRPAMQTSSGMHSRILNATVRDSLEYEEQKLGMSGMVRPRERTLKSNHPRPRRHCAQIFLVVNRGSVRLELTKEQEAGNQQTAIGWTLRHLRTGR